MFEQAKAQLYRLREAIDTLKRADNERVFLFRFNEAIAASQNVLIQLLMEGRGLRPPGFDPWFDTALERMKSDELMDLVRNARDFDFGDGPHKLRFAEGDAAPSTDDKGRPTNRETWWSMARSPGLHAAIDNPPRSHDGQPLERNDPVSLCEEVLATLELLIHEAEAATSA